jgi:uncharacterized protein (TIGR02246 family)
MLKMKNTIFLMIFVIAISTINAIGQTSAKMSKDEKEIRATLEKTADGWNAGDLDQYLSAYTKDATEMLPNGPTGGVEAIEKTMKEGFWKTGKPLQILRYENLEVRMLGKKGALVTGKFVLSGADRSDRTGWFTTVWLKTKDGWRMIHDHS